MKEHRSISIADQIFQQLERDILTGKYQRGEVLSELRLSGELGVSRTPVREAVRRLEQEHLLEDSPRGSIVVGISLEDTLDMYDIRLAAEGMAARRAAENITPEQLSKMREILELQSFYIKSDLGDKSEQIRNLDSRFHELLYLSGGSKTFYYTFSSLHKKIAKFRRASVTNHRRALASLSEHQAILSALELHDPDKAAEAVLKHVKNARDSMAEMEKKENGT